MDCLYYSKEKREKEAALDKKLYYSYNTVKVYYMSNTVEGVRQ